MRKKVFGRNFSRGTRSRRALFRSLLKALIVNGKIVTTKAKAKAMQKDLEKLVVLSKDGSLASRRNALSMLANKRELTEKLFNKIGPVFDKRKSGFTRSINLGRRLGDGAEMVRIEWTEEVPEKDESKKDEAEKPKKTLKKATKKVK